MGGFDYACQQFDDFDAFRETLVGWDTDPVQLSPGTLSLRSRSLVGEGLSVGRLELNQRVADLSHIDADSLGLVVTLGLKRWCGMEVAPGSLVVMGPGRDYRSALEPGWASIEFNVSRAVLAAEGSAWADAELRDLAPEQSVFALPAERVRELDRWTRALLDPAQPKGRAQAAQMPGRSFWAPLIRLLPDALPGRSAAAGRRARYELAVAALHLADRGESRTAGELAVSLGVSRRALEQAFRSALGVSPSRYLRGVRLNRARRALRRDRLSVTEAALDHGFAHLGRFAADYRRLFGELPSQTRPLAP